MIRRFFSWLFGDLIWPNIWWILGAVVVIFVILMIIGFFVPEPEEEETGEEEADPESGAKAKAAAAAVGAGAAGGLVHAARDRAADTSGDDDLGLTDGLGDDL